jgi:hypothetical protein
MGWTPLDGVRVKAMASLGTKPCLRTDWHIRFAAAHRSRLG